MDVGVPHDPVPLALLIVDDHEVVREGLQAALARDVRFELIGAVGSAQEALDVTRHVTPDVVIVDMRLPDSSGDELCRRLRSHFPQVNVVILSSYLTEEVVRRAVSAGAVAYVTKAAGLPELRATLDRVCADRATKNERLSAPAIVEYLDKLVRQRSEEKALTSQQARVLELAAEGLTYRGIAERLIISESTVRFHIQKMKVKFEATSKTDLIVQAVRMGLITPPQDEAAGLAGSA